jgi:hypothetical protein
LRHLALDHTHRVREAQSIWVYPQYCSHS